MTRYLYLVFCVIMKWQMWKCNRRYGRQWGFDSVVLKIHLLAGMRHSPLKKNEIFWRLKNAARTTYCIATNLQMRASGADLVLIRPSTVIRDGWMLHVRHPSAQSNGEISAGIVELWWTLIWRFDSLTSQTLISLITTVLSRHYNHKKEQDSGKDRYRTTKETKSFAWRRAKVNLYVGANTVTAPIEG